jgi:DNA-binding winged helix-turn-helix (wHTH) protein
VQSGRFRFDRFVLDQGDRQLTRDGQPVELNARYLDALALMVRDAGKMVSKDRFLDEVWRGVPVTDEALTQCIKTLRRQLGDEAGNPRFIETVPKHGYRFIAPVEEIEAETGSVGLEGHPTPDPSPSRGGEYYSLREFLLLGGAGTVGAGVAGIIGGLFYGFVGASQPIGPGTGAASVLLVLLWLTIAAALMGGVGVSFGIAAAGFVPGRAWVIAGGALGGLTVGGVVKLLGIDAFNLLLGRSPGDITGGTEGLLLGGAVGLGAWLASRGDDSRSLRRRVAIAGLAGGAAGIVIPLFGGRLMGGSLDLIARAFPGSRLRLDQLSGLFGESRFGPVSQMATGAIEGLLFAGCVVGAMLLARRNLGRER